MKKVEEFFIPIAPVPKGRPRFTKTGHSYTPSKTREYERNVCKYYSDHCGEYFDGAIRVVLKFFMPIPKSTTKKIKNLMHSGEYKHTKKPDVDNLAKSVIDGLLGVAYADDSQITTIHAYKEYSLNSGILISIFEDVE